MNGLETGLNNEIGALYEKSGRCSYEKSCSLVSSFHGIDLFRQKDMKSV